MERNRGSQVLAIVALLLAVGGLSLGFAAFSQTLTIKSSAEVNPVDKFNVEFFGDNDATSVAGVTSDSTVTGLKAATATINNNNHTITGLKATFTEPGQSVTYTFKARNTGEYIAYLRQVAFAQPSGAAGNALSVCTSKASAENPATQSLVDAACDDITLSVKVGSETAVTSTTPYTGTTHALAKPTNAQKTDGGEDTVVVTITYAANGDVADGDFEVTFGDVTIDYKSV